MAALDRPPLTEPFGRSVGPTWVTRRGDRKYHRPVSRSSCQRALTSYNSSRAWRRAGIVTAPAGRSVTALTPAGAPRRDPDPSGPRPARQRGLTSIHSNSGPLSSLSPSWARPLTRRAAGGVAWSASGRPVTAAAAAPARSSPPRAATSAHRHGVRGHRHRGTGLQGSETQGSEVTDTGVGGQGRPLAAGTPHEITSVCLMELICETALLVGWLLDTYPSQTYLPCV